MKNESIFNSIREYRDYIKGRPTLVTDKGVSYAELRHRIRMSYPPFRGERIRRTALSIIGLLVILTTVYCLVAS